MIDIFIYKIKKNKIKDKLHILSEQERKKAKLLKNEKDRNLYIAGKYLTRKVIGLQFKIKTDIIVFKSNEYGRPSLACPQIKNFDFNLSHSGDFVVLAVSNNKVGVDIEQIKPIDLEIAKNYFHKEEINFLYSRKGKEMEKFYKIWTLKESFIKAVGKGLSYPLKSFHFKFKGNRARMHSKSKNKKWRFQMLNICPDYELAVCSNSDVETRITFCN